MFIKLILLIVVLACVAPFFVRGPDGLPLISLDDWNADVANDLEKVTNTTAAPSTVTIYKWQDEEGVWQFSTEPHSGAETMELDGNINIIPSNPGAGETKDVTAPSSLSSIPAGLQSLDPEQLSELMEKVNGMQETVDQRKADIDAALGNN